MPTIKNLLIAVVIVLANINLHGQVGIGTSSPNASSILDLTSTTQGLLAPRMSTTQRAAITTPTEGLLVFDITLDAFYFYDATSSAWKKLSTNKTLRDNYVLVKSEADFPTPSGGIITLDENFLYEINGNIAMTNSINLNNATIIGYDIGEDILARATGNLFVGSKGGELQNITAIATGGSVFNLDDTANDQELIVIAIDIFNSASVGTIKGYSLATFSNCEYKGNTTGITFDSIKDLILSNQEWLDTNNGTYETFTGAFEIIEKEGGFSDVDAGRTAVDVSANPTVDRGVMLGVVFEGPGAYVNRYTTATNPYNFTNDWFVNSTSIPIESDFVATGDLYIATSVATNVAAANMPIKIAATTAGINLFRFSSSANNILTYTGAKSRFFTCTGSISITAAGNNKTFNFYIAKNGVILPASKQSRKIATGGDVGALSITVSVLLDTNDFMEFWVENTTDASDITAESMNLAVR